ncbi:hypothetical protein RQP46_006210 [Phenoliferia psychrophenolica]
MYLEVRGLVRGMDQHTLVTLKLLASQTNLGPLVDFFATHPFTNLHKLVIWEMSPALSISGLASVLPSLAILEILGSGIKDRGCDIKDLPAFMAPQIKLLRFFKSPHTLSGCPRIHDILGVVLSPSSKGLQQLEILGASKAAFETAVGLMLLKECEKRSISVLCRYGYITYQQLTAK